MKKLILLLLFTPLVFFGNVQEIKIDSAQKEWKTIIVKGVGSFDLPPTMEIQKDKMLELVDKAMSIYNYGGNDIVAQQSGLNEDMKMSGKDLSGLYGRIMLSTNIGLIGEFPKDFCLNSVFTKTDLILKNMELKNQYENGVEEVGQKIIEWFRVDLKEINEMCALHVSYIRSGHKSNVFVNEYVFYNNDRTHNLVLSYRVDQEDYWKLDFDKVLKSFVLTDSELPTSTNSASVYSNHCDDKITNKDFPNLDLYSKLDIQMAEDYIIKGMSKSESGFYKSSISDYDKAIELFPFLPTAFYNRGISKINIGDYDEATSDFSEVICLNQTYNELELPQDVVARCYYNRGNIYNLNKDSDLAVLDYNKAIEIDNVPEAYGNRGLIKYFKGKLTEACDDWNTGVKFGLKLSKEMIDSCN